MHIPSGRDVVGSWRSGGPVVVWAIITICSVVWLLETALRLFSHDVYSALMVRGMFIPAVIRSCPWSWFTSMFLHAPTILHVLFNMLTLWVVGPYLERMLGHLSFAVMYVVSGLGGAVGIFVWSRVTGEWATASYGASGAIFGLFGAVLIAHRAMGEDVRSIVIWIAINLAVPLVVSGVAWQAHVGGLVAGGVLTWLMIAGPSSLRSKKINVRMAVYGTIVILALVGIGVLCLM